MATRSNTIVFTFDPTSQRISAFDIHEWLHVVIRIQEHNARMTQIDFIKEQVYVKLIGRDYMLFIINDTNLGGEYKHLTGEVSVLEIAIAGMDYKRIRVANLQPEVPDEKLRNSLAPFGQILDIQNEMWARTYLYTVANGIRQVTMLLTKHVLSHLAIAGQKCLYLTKVN